MKKLNITLTLIASLICLPLPLIFAQYVPGGFFSMARSGDIEGLKKILETKPSQFAMDSALEAAVIGQQPEAIKLLVQSGANANFINPQKTALLVNAIMLGFFDSAKTLIELGADCNVMGYHRLYHGYPMNWHWSPLMAASYQGNLDLVKLFIEHGADINTQGYSVAEDEHETAADIAAYSGFLEILELLLNKGAALNDDTIFKAVRGGHLEVVKFLIKKGFDVNTAEPQRKKTLLMEAAWWGHLELVKYLISAGADVNIVDDNGYTTLSDAAANGGQEFPNQVEIIKELLRNGADIEKSAPFKLTPLMRAKDPKVIEFLIKAGAN